MGTQRQFKTTIEDSLLDVMHQRAIERMKKYGNLLEHFGEPWIDKMFATNFELGISPMLDFFMVADAMLADKVLSTMDCVVGSFDSSNKAFLEKIQRLKEYLPFRQMRQYFVANLLELYVSQYLKKNGFDSELRLKAGADLLVQTKMGSVDVEITVRNKSLLQHELKDILRRCLPPSVRDSYRVETIGQFGSDNEFYSGMASLLTKLEEVTGQPENFDVVVGENNQVRFSFEHTKIGYIAESAAANFASHEYVFNEIGYKLRDKQANPNQTGGTTPTIVIVEAGDMPYSPELAIMDYFTKDIEYPRGKIPENIEVAVMYWFTVERIEPWYAIGTSNLHSSSRLIDPGLLGTLGVKTVGN